MICRRATYFTDSEVIGYYPKYIQLNRRLMKTKNHVRNYVRGTMLKNNFLWFTLDHMTVMKIKISTIEMIISLTTFL